MEKKKSYNIWTGLEVPPETVETVYPTAETGEIIDYKIVDTVVKTGVGESDFIIVPKVVVDSKVNRQDYINSFSDEVGILNILKKVQLTGDNSLLMQRESVSLPIEKTVGGRDLQAIYDTSILPTSKIAANDAVTAGVAAFDSLPEELKNKMSMADFVAYFGEDQLKAYLDSKNNKGGAE